MKRGVECVTRSSRNTLTFGAENSNVHVNLGPDEWHANAHSEPMQTRLEVVLCSSQLQNMSGTSTEKKKLTFDVHQNVSHLMLPSLAVQPPPGRGPHIQTPCITNFSALQRLAYHKNIVFPVTLSSPLGGLCRGRGCQSANCHYIMPADHSLTTKLDARSLQTQLIHWVESRPLTQVAPSMAIKMIGPLISHVVQPQHHRKG
ncbi:hypothetical protein HD554DRAFT_740776 [Boletus coccyginus]|nr:hypothetical protein HD554DRAFT_740776 [Boletus coccyginus]